jgi:hypothetical protein
MKTVTNILKNVVLVNRTPFLERDNRLLLSASVLVMPMVLSLILLGLPSAIACDDFCDDDNFNTGYGSNLIVAGINNSAFGFSVLRNNSGGNDNTAVGYSAMFLTGGGSPAADTAVGSQALETIGSASYCVAVGYYALNSNGGNFNTALGYDTMAFSGSGAYNTATGAEALLTTDGQSNTADGAFALYFDNAGGSYNTAVGRGALYNDRGGNNNTGVGYQALHANTGSNNIAIGSSAGANLTTGSNNIDIGGPGVAGESNTTRIGKASTQTTVYVHGVYGATATGGVAVFVDSNGHLGTTTSSVRYKDEIKPMDKASEAILALKPVTFRYRKDLDPEGIPQFGLVAEEVEKVNSNLVAHDEQGKPYTVRYEAVNTMLLNEFLKEHLKVEQLEKQVATLTAGLEKVCTQLELRGPAPQTVQNSH